MFTPNKIQNWKKEKKKDRLFYFFVHLPNHKICLFLSSFPFYNPL